MRTINKIILHCTATAQTATVKSILNYWREVKKWRAPGYHYLITRTGKIEPIWPISLPSNGVKGHNQDSIHIGYIGGIDHNGNAIDNRTPQQIVSQIKIIRHLKQQFPNAQLKGHNELANKKCPSFSVSEWRKKVKL